MGDAVKRLSESEIAMEYAALKAESHCPKGMYIVPSAESIFIWDGVLFVHQGYYADAVLKFRIQFPQDYPSVAVPPAVTFITDVFHPLIETETGTLNVKQRFSLWRQKQDHVFHILHWTKTIFKKEFLNGLKESDCLNKEAFRYHDSTQSFAALAFQSAMLSQSAPRLYTHKTAQDQSDKPHEIAFRDPQLACDGVDIDKIRRQLGLSAWALNVPKDASKDAPSELQGTL